MNRCRGFSLVEMLVALSVSAVLISLVYGVVVLAQRSTQAVNDRAALSEQMRIGWQFIDAAIARAQPVTDPDDEDNPIGFVGNEDRLTFIADQPGYLGPGGLTRITLERRDTGDSDALVLIREPFDYGTSEAGTDASEAILVDRLDSLELTYYGTADDDEEPAWLDRWEGQALLPGLIEIRIVPSGAPAWPVLIGRPMTGSETAGLEAPIDEDGEPLPEELLETPDDELMEGMLDAPVDA
jgi:general secretion pathway protein J